MMADTLKMRVSERFQVRKWNGDPPKPGENKPPVEIVTFGNDIPTTRTMFSDGRVVCQEVIDPFTLSVLENRK